MAAWETSQPATPPSLAKGEGGASHHPCPKWCTGHSVNPGDDKDYARYASPPLLSLY